MPTPSDQNMLYWYDEQIKRYLIQLIRIFSNFRVAEQTRDGVRYNRIPARYGDPTRMVSQIMNKLSENTVTSAPMITLHINAIELARERTQEPFYSETSQVIEKKYDPETDTYLNEPGNKYSVYRYMPVPYNLKINVDIWTTNTDTKLQVLEQILILFNPSIQIQSNSNPLDWTNVFEVELTDVTWSSRTIPVGTEESMDITTLQFTVPIWISPPAKVRRQQIIEQIITDIHLIRNFNTLGYTPNHYDFFDDFPEATEVVTTPGNYSLRITDNRAILVTRSDQPKPWSDLLTALNKYITPTSLIKLNTTNDSDNDLDLIIGSVAVDELDPTALIFTLDTDTLPSNSLPNITRIIDPTVNNPFNGLEPQTAGQRYLITKDIPQVAGWNFASANANDIIEFNGSDWVVSFNSAIDNNEQYVTNNYTGQQYKWTGDEWISSWQGTYNSGYWRLMV